MSSFLITIGEKQSVKLKLTCKDCNYFWNLQNNVIKIDIPFECCLNKCCICVGLHTCIDLKAKNPICVSFKKIRDTIHAI